MEYRKLLRMNLWENVYIANTATLVLQGLILA